MSIGMNNSFILMPQNKETREIYFEINGYRQIRICEDSIWTRRKSYAAYLNFLMIEMSIGSLQAEPWLYMVFLSKTTDIDLGCSKRLADLLEADGCLFRQTDDGKRWFKYGENIGIF